MRVATFRRITGLYAGMPPAVRDARIRRVLRKHQTAKKRAAVR